MSVTDRSLIRAGLAMIGTIIGAGLFALPAAFSRVGFLPGTLLFAILTIVVTLTHLILAEQLLATRERQRLPGLALRLGPFASQVSSVTYPLHIIASNYAYILLGGEFMAVVGTAAGFSIPIPAWQLLFWLGGSLTVLFGLKAVAKLEAHGTWLLMFVLVLTTILAVPVLDIRAASYVDWNAWHIPFGIFLFALSGLSVVGEVVEIAGRRRTQALWAVGAGTIIAAILSWIFGVALFLAARGFPIRDAADLVAILPSGVGLIIPVLGFLAVATSYLTTAQDLVVTLETDQKWKKPVALCVGLISPVILLAVLSRDFLTTIGFIGGVFVGINSLIVCALGYQAMFRKRNRFVHIVGTAICALLIGVYVFGILQKIFTRQGL